MLELVLIGVVLVCAVAYVGWTAGMIYGLRKAERDDLDARDRWANDYERRQRNKGAA